jgi:hypothetical protein
LKQSKVESWVSFEVREKKKRKINQLLKASSLSSNFDLKAMAKSVGMNEEELKEFIEVNSIE